MDFIGKCFEKNAVAFTVKLENAGFSAEQAEEFLSETVSAITNFIKNTDLEIIIGIFLSDDPARILNSVNVDAIAHVMNMKPDQVSSGLEAITPILSQVFMQQSNEIVAATASLAWT